MVEWGLRGKGFRFVLDTDWGRDVACVAAYEELLEVIGNGSQELKKPVLTSACPGFICYAEAVHPYLIPHLSRLKSPQAILGTLVKSLLPKAIARERGVHEKGALGPGDVYIVGVQPCFDKKLEGARGELTSAAWMEEDGEGTVGVRDVDCVITTRELVTLIEDGEGGKEFRGLPRVLPPREGSRDSLFEDMIKLLSSTEDGEYRYTPLPNPSPQSPQQQLATTTPSDPSQSTGTSGGYLQYILLRLQSTHPNSTISITRGRNSDTVEYTLSQPPSSPGAPPTEIIKFARSYGFRNIQNLVRKLKPQKRRVLPRFGKKGAGGQVVLGGAGQGEGTGYAYVEVMACPGGCTNGGGQVKVGDKLITGEGETVGGGSEVEVGVESQAKQREWLGKVDEAYWSSDDSPPPSGNSDSDEMEVDSHPQPLSLSRHQQPQQHHPFGIDPDRVKTFLQSWSEATGVPVEKLLFTGYRKVEDEFNKEKLEEEAKTATMRAAELAGKAGGGW